MNSGETNFSCRCSRSVGAISALFASLAAAALVAQDRCLDAGGRVSDVAWVCEMGPATSVSLWSLVTPVALGAIVLAVGIPVYFAVNALASRFMAGVGRQIARRSSRAA